MKEYRKYCLSEGRIVDCGTELISKQTREQYHGDFALVEVENELDNIDNYTIENGQLVKASPEVIAERQRFKLLAQRESIRAERQRRYDGQEITSLYWNWVESSDEADKAKWIAAKNQVRQELPYPEN